MHAALCEVGVRNDYVDMLCNAIISQLQSGWIRDQGSATSVGRSVFESLQLT
jgi:hypothetical protein